MSGLVQVLTPDDECSDALRVLLDENCHKRRPFIVAITSVHSQVAMACPNGFRALAAAHAAMEVFEDDGATAILSVSQRAKAAVDRAIKQLRKQGESGSHRAHVEQARLRWDAVLNNKDVQPLRAPGAAVRH
jgi:hypothetical protein